MPTPSRLSNIPSQDHLPDSTTGHKENAEASLRAWAPQGPRWQSKLASNYLSTSILADFS